MAHDETRLELLIISAGSSVVVVSQTIQVVFLYQALLGSRYFGGPVKLLLGGTLVAGIRRFFLCNLEGLIQWGGDSSLPIICKRETVLLV